MRGCPEETSQARTPRAPASKTHRSDPQTRLAKWSERFDEKKPPPAELVRDAATPAGQLENGLRYILAPQADQPGEVSLRLIVLAGSMHEREGEHGLAHFVEHLAFMGRRSRPNGHALEEFERLGLTRGADSNAHTARDHTLYRLDLPQADAAALAESFGFLRDIVDGLLFRAEDVDAERRVVLRELEDTKDGQPFDLRAAAILPGVPAARLGPGGLTEEVAQATPEKLRGLWRRTYRPARIALVVSGDFEMEAMTARIRETFGSLPAGSPEAVPDPGNPMQPRGPALDFVPYPSDEGVRLTVAARLPVKTLPDGPELRRRQLTRELALKMLAQRLSRDAQERDAARVDKFQALIELLPGITWLEVSSKVAPASAIRLLDPFLRDFLSARDSGFSDVEFAEARGDVRRAIRENFSERLSQSNESLATLLADSIRTGRLVESPEDEVNRARTDLLSITRQECEALLRDEWRDTSLSILLSGEVADLSENKAQEALERALAASRQPAPEHGKIRPLLIDPFGTPGTLVRQDLDEGRGMLEAEFANGVLVRLQPMPSLGGIVEVGVDVGHGMLSVPADHPGLGMAATFLCNWNPFGDFSELQLDAAMADRELSHWFCTGTDRFFLEGSTDRDNLATQLEILCASIERPGLVKRPRPWKAGERDLAYIKQQTSDPFINRFRQLRHGEDPRMDLYSPDLMNCDSAMVAKWLLPMLAKDRLRVRIAGDFAPAEALAVLANTFGALPLRSRWREGSPYPLPPATPPGQYRYVAGSGEEKGKACLMLAAAPADNPEEDIRHQLLQSLLKSRVESLLRDSLGESYLLRGLRMDVAGRPREWFGLLSFCAVDRCEVVAGKLRTVVEGVRRGEWSADEYLRAYRPLQPAFRKRLRDPDEVLAQLTELETLPRLADLDPAKLAAMEPALRKLAARVLDLEGAVELQTLPPE